MYASILVSIFCHMHTYMFIWIYVSFFYSCIIYFVSCSSQSEEVTLKSIHPTCTLKHYSCDKKYLMCIVKAVVHGEVLATGWIWPKLDTQHTNCCPAAYNHVLVCLTLRAINAEVLLLLPQLC